MQNDFIYYKMKQMTPLTELPPEVVKLLPEGTNEEPWEEPNSIQILRKNKNGLQCDKNGGNYFMGGLPALMQAVRLLQQDNTAQVTYVHDGQRKKSTQSAHQGHVHPTEWTTPELGTFKLFKIILQNLHLLPATPPDDLFNYSYIHLPLSKMRPTIFVKNVIFRLIHTLFSKNSISADDRWQCKAVRESLAFHKALSDEIVAAGDEPTFAANWRLIWSPDQEGIIRKKALWNELGIQTEDLSPGELRQETLLRDDLPLYGLKVLGDGKFFPNVDGKICEYLKKKYPNRFTTREAIVSELYTEEKTNQPFAVLEKLPDGTTQIVEIDAFFGSPGHNKVFKEGSKKPLWDEVPVAGVSTLWVATFDKAALISRFKVADTALIQHLKQLAGSANLTNLHVTVWDACIEGDQVYVIARATEGANFNSPFADPRDLENMRANINRFLIGSWKLITAGSCTRKTTTSNVPELKDNFIHGLSGIGFSFSGAPKERAARPNLSDNPFGTFETTE